MDSIVLNFWSVALLAVAGAAYTRRARALFLGSVILFVPVAAAATLTVYGAEHPFLAWTLLVALLGLGTLGYLLYAIDRTFACFTIEMTYATLPASVLWPLLVGANWLGTLL